jgi:hypothetical protein
LQPLVACNERCSEKLGTRDDHPIGRILMQTCQFYGAKTDRGINWEKVQTAQRLAPRDPFADGQTQLQSAALNQKRDLPRADRRYPQPVLRKCCLDLATRTSGELLGSGYPPDPGVRIQQERA